eukprot:TRINITY_DN34526_c0_g1_i1.p1 TRINITY_DN34526_c0_g1~~TRINITY_DN34526_c0_g1_i1.p1  ORF type:complete len:438 (+),score=54.97 TRINITY_DN34526_c0_g1_i1:32-1345(+)
MMDHRLISILLCGDVPTQKIKVPFPVTDLNSLQSMIANECNVNISRLEIYDDEFDTYVLLRYAEDIKGDRVQISVRCEQQHQHHHHHQQHASHTQYPPPVRLASGSHNSDISCMCGRGEKIQFHCQEDGSFVCALCAVMGNYRSRQLQTLSEAAGTFLNSIPEMEGKIESEVAHVNRLLSHLTVFEESRNSEDHIKKMHETCDTLVAIINRKRAEMDEKMRHLQKEDPSHIMAERAVLTSKHKELRSIQKDLHSVATDSVEVDNLRVISTIKNAQAKLPLYLDIEPASLPHKVPLLNAAAQASILNELCLTMAEDSVLYPPPNTYRYRIVGGGSYSFDVSTIACSEFGLYFMQRIRVKREGVFMSGTILGVLSCALWWISDDDTCAAPLIDGTTRFAPSEVMVIGQGSPSHYPEEPETNDVLHQLHQDINSGRYRRQ